MHLAKKILKLMMKERQVTTGDLIVRQFDGGKKDVLSIEDNGLRRIYCRFFAQVCIYSTIRSRSKCNQFSWSPGVFINYHEPNAN